MRFNEIVQPDRYGLFIVKNNKWVLHFDYGTNKEAADREKEYLVNAGVRAEIFKKKTG